MLPWTIDELDWRGLEPERSRADALIYYLVAAGSFIETGADRYSANLSTHFSDPALQHWLAESWEPEELQHGRALRRYVEAVWPELDWARGYEDFFAEYSPLCNVEQLEHRPALELAARCLVETGTATFYAALHRRAEEPLLKDLAERIRQDEVRHYARFRKFLDAHRNREPIGRAGVLRALCRRAGKAQNQDAYLGFKHAWRMRNSGATFDDALFQRFRAELRGMMACCYPYRTALQMMLRPLDLNRTLVKLSLPLLERAARCLLFA